MLWATFAPLVLAQVKACAGLTSTPSFEPQWEDKQREFANPSTQSELLLRVTTVRKLGRDEHFDDTATDFSRITSGMRECNLNIQARSWDMSDSTLAIEYLERLCTRFIARESVRQALLAANFAVVGLESITNIPGVTIDGRHLDVANADIRFRGAFTDTDGAESLDWFDHIAFSSRFAAGGVVLPVPPNVTDVLIPPGV